MKYVAMWHKSMYHANSMQYLLLSEFLTGLWQDTNTRNESDQGKILFPPIQPLHYFQSAYFHSSTAKILASKTSDGHTTYWRRGDLPSCGTHVLWSSRLAQIYQEGDSEKQVTHCHRTIWRIWLGLETLLKNFRKTKDVLNQQPSKHLWYSFLEAIFTSKINGACAQDSCWSIVTVLLLKFARLGTSLLKRICL